MTRTFRVLLVWVFVAAVAFAMQLNWMSATYSPDGFVPVGNDAFYHARRIIDTARDLSGFYEFDFQIHAPEGSLLTWPWGYDYAMALLLRMGTELGLAADPMRFLAYVPPFAALVTIALTVAIAIGLRLSLWSMLLLALCVALSPLTQGMHSIGSIDHHFAEYMIILAFMACAIRWVQRPESRTAAAATALVLGLGPAVHNGLFALQVPLLAALLIYWLRGEQVPTRSAATFGLTLTGVTVAVLLPSLPFRLGMSEYYLLSWFHLYVASSTTIVVGYLAMLTASRQSMLGLLAVGILLSLPLLRDLVLASSFVGKEADALHAIQEARSLWNLYQERGFLGVSYIYSSLIFLAPLVWLGCVYALTRVRDRGAVMVFMFAALTLPLMLAQFRFQYYGSLGLYLPLILVADRAWTDGARRGWLIALAALLVASYYPAVRHGLGGGLRLGNDVYYAMTRMAMPSLADECQRDPGIVLARGNEGHYIRYHTDCSVIANNFLLTEQHLDATRRVGLLFAMSPEELLQSGFPIKYVFVRARGVILLKSDGSIGLVPAGEANIVSDRLTDALLWGDVATVPGQFRLLHETKVPGGGYQYSRLWKIERAGISGALGVDKHHAENDQGKADRVPPGHGLAQKIMREQGNRAEGQRHE